ncbi:MAG: rubrerythrin family protein [Bacillota bacterium]
MSTVKNLETSFAGESQANRKYLAFAKKADEEGYPAAAKLFRASAEAETIHAMQQLKALGGIKSTADNLKSAIAGETYEFTEMYPGFIAEADKPEDKQAKRAFELANNAEKSHAELYQKALDSLNEKRDVNYYVCEICGFITEGSAPDKCPNCGVPANKFKNIG